MPRSPIGVLVDAKMLRQALRGRNSKERVDLYRTIALSELQVPLVVFAPGGVQLRRRRVRGYVATPRGWRRRTVRLPQVIHKRALFRSTAVMRLLLRMERQGTVFVNPPNMQDKAAMHRILYAHPALRPHLPPTQRYRWSEAKRLLADGISIILKPRIGSVGRGGPAHRSRVAGLLHSNGAETPGIFARAPAEAPLPAHRRAKLHFAALHRVGAA